MKWFLLLFLVCCSCEVKYPIIIEKKEKWKDGCRYALKKKYRIDASSYFYAPCGSFAVGDTLK